MPCVLQRTLCAMLRVLRLVASRDEEDAGLLAEVRCLGACLVSRRIFGGGAEGAGGDLDELERELGQFEAWRAGRGRLDSLIQARGRELDGEGYGDAYAARFVEGMVGWEGRDDSDVWNEEEDIDS